MSCHFFLSTLHRFRPSALTSRPALTRPPSLCRPVAQSGAAGGGRSGAGGAGKADAGGAAAGDARGSRPPAARCAWGRAGGAGGGGRGDSGAACTAAQRAQHESGGASGGRQGGRAGAGGCAGCGMKHVHLRSCRLPQRVAPLMSVAAPCLLPSSGCVPPLLTSYLRQLLTFMLTQCCV